jgi:DNA-binding MarR family transcriptional regulator
MTDVRASGGPRAVDRTPAGDALTDLVMTTFRLNGLFLQAAESIAGPAGLTAAWWQVLGAVLDQPRSVAGVSREMGLTRQSVQRTADLLVERGLAEYQPNPAHRRAKLLAPSEAGWSAIRALSPAQHEWANGATRTVSEDEIRAALAVLERLIGVLSD